MCQGLAPWCLQYDEVPQKTLLYVSIHPFLCIISPVAVGSDRLKPFTHASSPCFGVPTGGSSKRLFYCPYAQPPSCR
jgi:hypothetical protein